MVMPFSIAEYFDLFHAIGSPYNFDRYYKYRGFHKIEINQDWTDQITDEENKNGWGKKVQLHKQVSYEADVVGNPFVKIAPATKNFLLLDKEKHFIQMRLWTQFKNVPYCDAFISEE